MFRTLDRADFRRAASVLEGLQYSRLRAILTPLFRKPLLAGRVGREDPAVAEADLAAEVDSRAVALSRFRGSGPRFGRRVYIRVANPTSGARSPGFDVTPAELITGIITPAGIFKPKELWANRCKLGYRE